MSDHSYTIIDELRQATRFQKERGTEFAVLWQTEGEEVLVDVHDESLGGLGVIIKSDLGFHVGQLVNVVYAGSFMDATIRHIEPYGDGEFIVGLKCKRG